MRPNVCISASTSNASSGRAHRNRRIAARSGDCTSAWKRVSMSADSARRPATDRLSTSLLGPLGARREGVPAAVVLRLELLDQPLHLDRVRLAMPVARTGLVPPELSISTSENNRLRSMSTDAMCAMCIECSRPPTSLRRVVHDARRRDRDLRRKQRLPRLSRLARKTWSPAILRPLDQKNAAVASAERRHCHEDEPLHVRAVSFSARRAIDASEVRSPRKRAAVKAFRPIGRASAGHRCYAQFAYAPPSARVPGPQDHQLPVGKSDQVLPAARQRRHPAADRRRLSGLQRRPPVRGLPHLRRQDAGTRPTTRRSA